MKTVIQNTFIISLALCVLIIGPAFGQTGGPYELSWSTIDGGGGTSAGGSYTLTGTIGQPNAGSASGGIYELFGGFWPGGSITTAIIGDFCGSNFVPPDGYVDVWDLMQFADHWHIRTGEVNWDEIFDLIGPSFADPDGYIDVWDLMTFADHWHEGEPP